MSINKVTVSGNLTKDPQLRMTQGGSNVLTFGMAVNDRTRNQQTGEWSDYANYVDCVLFGNRAEPMSRMLSKGTKVFVEGKLRWSSWEKDGQKRSKLEVIVSDIDIASKPRQEQQGQQYGQPQYQQAPQYRQQPSYQQPVRDVYDDDIRF